jgi:hypothetical protein
VIAGQDAYIEGEHDAVFYATQIPFLATISLTFMISVLYSSSILLLVLLSYASKTMKFVRWILPVQTLPIRSVGIVAGVLVFLIFGGTALVRRALSG